jgi:predicted component of type VI protein secretion system
MGVVMVMFRADQQRRSFSITRDMTVIGRREDCDLRIPLGDISRKHCRLILDGEAIKVEDLGSSNGTYKNGERIQQAELGAGDTLQVGPVIFVLQVDGFPADEDLKPQTVQSSANDDTKTGGKAAAAGVRMNCRGLSLCYPWPHPRGGYVGRDRGRNGGSPASSMCSVPRC